MRSLSDRHHDTSVSSNTETCFFSHTEKEMKQAPQFVEKMQNTGVAEGAPVRLECRVMGMPQPLIYWKKDNDTISHSKERLR